ncbi:DUF1270 family protein, partial [Staphylococcus aureus]|nr:DUF1270 family protein [Staphylococcus aureus]HCG2721339.1 DUF1270 family protein [Staphylococcus aureus]HDF1602589.1 DUF1270 family protein [Staphylococcus aureus]HDF8179639.1 DUF1270 family protein [Staphylococcus aureus]HDG4494791.1 DUF1270 family protein [Staphylococcus aureus]
MSDTYKSYLVAVLC